MNFRFAVFAAAFMCATAAVAVARLEFPLPKYPDCSQAIGHKKYELDQKTPRRIAWGVFARFAGIDPMVKPSHHKYGVEIQLESVTGIVFSAMVDGTFTPTESVE